MMKKMQLAFLALTVLSSSMAYAHSGEKELATKQSKSEVVSEQNKNTVVSEVMFEQNKNTVVDETIKQSAEAKKTGKHDILRTMFLSRRPYM